VGKNLKILRKLFTGHIKIRTVLRPGFTILLYQEGKKVNVGGRLWRLAAERVEDCRGF